MEDAPGWYPDPWTKGALRYWNGRSWTAQQAVRQLPGKPPAPPHPTLPLAAGIGAFLAVVIPVELSRLLIRALVDTDWPLPVYMVIAVVVGYGPSLMWWWYVAKRWGGGQMRPTAGIFARRVDWAVGPMSYLGSIALLVGVGVLIRALKIPYTGNLEVGDGPPPERAYIISLVVAAVVAAPIVEEIAFRGVLLRGLLSRVGAPAAIAIQAVLFGAVHFDTEYGAGNIGLIIALSAVGVSLGTTAYLTRRLAPSILGHAIHNSIAMALLLHNLDYF